MSADTSPETGATERARHVAALRDIEEYLHKIDLPTEANQVSDAADFFERTGEAEARAAWDESWKYAARCGPGMMIYGEEAVRDEAWKHSDTYARLHTQPDGGK